MITPPYEPGCHEIECRNLFGNSLVCHDTPKDTDSGLSPTSVFICFTSRSGSYWLSEALASSGTLPSAGELFNHKTIRSTCEQQPQLESLSQYSQWIQQKTARNNYFITKVSPKQLLMLSRNQLIPRIFSSPKFIFVRRRDLLAQAISLVFAKHHGTWRNGGPSQGEPPYDANEIRLKVDGLAVANAQLEAFFAMNGLIPFDVVYEDFSEDPETTLSNLSQWLHEPSVHYAAENVQAIKDSSGLKDQWRKRFLEEAAKTS